MLKKVHMIGIGGIGMSALARYYKSHGWDVSGSDSGESDLINDLRSEGINIKKYEDEGNISYDLDLVVYTIAIQETNLELVKAREMGIEVLTYPEALGKISENKKVIAVCGTHGKTTTTAMTFFALREAGIDASMIVGSLIENDGRRTNYVHGDSEWIIIEACEYRRSFLNYNPNIIVVTNIDADHLDYYRDIEDVKSAFQEFVNKLGGDGQLVIHQNEDYLSFKNKNIVDDIQISKSDLSVPGAHNRENAKLVLGLVNVLGLDMNKAKIGLRNFKGTWRRQEYKGKYFDMDCYDDYAHHPTEISATLEAIKEKVENKKKVIAIFMPHLYSRTKLLLDDFARCFTDADEVILLPIYAAREQMDETITSDVLQEKILEKDENKLVFSFGNMNDVAEYLKTKNNDYVVVTMGAGDIFKLYDLL